ncbi:hypothetical protein BDW62DRAFT_175468 [Aspergillus aurantiobrunneus]
MPRRSRPIEYDDVIDDIEHEVYPSRTKGEPLLVDRDARYSSYGHRMPRGPGPVVDVLPERRHIRDHAKPEIPHESYEYVRDDVLAAERLAQLDLNAYRTEEVGKGRDAKHSAHGPGPHGRRRSKVHDVEEAYFSLDDPKHGYTDSESDDIEEFVGKSKRPISLHDYGRRKEALPRSKSVKEERRVRRSKYEDGAYSKGNRSLEAYARDRNGPRHDAAPRTRHRSHYHIDLEDESDDSDESEIDVIPQRGRRGVTRRDRIEQKYSARRRGASSSLSSPESAGSSEEELPKVPLPAPVPPMYKESSRRHKSLGHAPAHQIPRPPSPPSPPRGPSLETVLTEREARHKKRIEKEANEEVGIEKRSRESLQLTHEPHGRRKKGKPVTVVKEPELAGHTDLLVEDERVSPRGSHKKREIVEEEHYPARDPQPSRSSPLSETMDDWAIVRAPSNTRYSPEKELPIVDVHEESRHSRRKDRQSKYAGDEERDPRHKGDTPRGKVGPRYIGVRDRRDRLWTEITKDLVVKEAIERAGFEYEEMDSVYYIFSYLHPDDVSALVEHSDDIRRARRRRIQEIQRERASVPPSSRRSPNKSAPALPERPPSPPVPPSPPRQHREDRREERKEGRRQGRRRRERERVREREEDFEESSRWRARSGWW